MPDLFCFNFLRSKYLATILDSRFRQKRQLSSLESFLETFLDFIPDRLIDIDLYSPSTAIDSILISKNTITIKEEHISKPVFTDQTPIFIDSSPAISPLAEEMEISMLLTPPGYSIYDGDCFTQPEFDALFAFVMNQITIYCRDNYPKNFLEHEARVKLYMDISRGFKFANVHNLIPKYEDGMPHGPSSGNNRDLVY
ncbi:hypothetical protein PGT21_004357 [Puccinia graminis f. sp. tritici]|uniref:Uncharacterized protein n=1 Tax=Puccinia graminis f. sp. tritici TaxID=56615 RepID=A0A5B0NQX3_PUCGR|nr:hypothetical protein PGT21_004357 [Puccinia graminis f. sp. tritici]